ncbi:MAG TPA: ATP-binding protein [bacterium]|nr:ATP-binding protein [bacterium]
MPKPNAFLEKLIKRLDRIDKDTLQQVVRDLAQENRNYLEVFDYLQEGLLIVSSEGELQTLNRQASDWLGIKIPKSGSMKLYDQLEDPVFSRFLEDHVPGLDEKRVDDFHFLQPLELYLRCFLIPMDIEPGKKLVLILLQNMTPQKAQQLDMDRVARIESLVSLAAGVAHEIGNPLNSLSIHLQLLKKEIRNFPSERRKIIENSLTAMNQEANRLDRIVRNFLKASRKPPLRFRQQDLNEIVEDALQFLEPELHDASVKVSFRPDRKLPFFMLDRERLYQAFLNIIKNALEAMPEGGVLKVNVSHRENVAAVRFEDEGKGISGKDQPHIFEAYFTTKDEGSGLGLMTVYNTVSEHGGRIDVESKLGKGTVFTLFLPVRQPKLQLPKYDIAAKR